LNTKGAKLEAKNARFGFLLPFCTKAGVPNTPKHPLFISRENFLNFFVIYSWLLAEFFLNVKMDLEKSCKNGGGIGIERESPVWCRRFVGSVYCK